MKQSESIRLTLNVNKKEYLTPHYIRVYLTGEGVEAIANTTLGTHNKILIPPKGINEIHFPEFDFAKGLWKSQPDGIRPIVRTYTHRGIDLNTNEIWIDFVAHGDEGVASGWAINAQKGDMLGVMMRAGEKELYPKVENYILIGDATAIPVLGAILENLPETAQGACIIEVHGEEDEQRLQTKARIQFQWLHNANPHNGSRLAEAMKALPLPEKNRYAHVAAEFSSVKEIRNYLRKEMKWEKEELNAYSYWKAGVAEDKSSMERRQENNTD